MALFIGLACLKNSEKEERRGEREKKRRRERKRQRPLQPIGWRENECMPAACHMSSSLYYPSIVWFGQVFSLISVPSLYWGRTASYSWFGHLLDFSILGGYQQFPNMPAIPSFMSHVLLTFPTLPAWMARKIQRRRKAVCQSGCDSGWWWQSVYLSPEKENGRCWKHQEDMSWKASWCWSSLLLFYAMQCAIIFVWWWKVKKQWKVTMIEGWTATTLLSSYLHLEGRHLWVEGENLEEICEKERKEEEKREKKKRKACVAIHGANSFSSVCDLKHVSAVRLISTYSLSTILCRQTLYTSWWSILLCLSYYVLYVIQCVTILLISYSSCMLCVVGTSSLCIFSNGISFQKKRGREGGGGENPTRTMKKKKRREKKEETPGVVKRRTVTKQ